MLEEQTGGINSDTSNASPKKLPEVPAITSDQRLTLKGNCSCQHPLILFGKADPFDRCQRRGSCREGKPLQQLFRAWERVRKLRSEIPPCLFAGVRVRPTVVACGEELLNERPNSSIALGG